MNESKRSHNPAELPPGPVAVIDVGAYSTRLRIIQYNPEGAVEILEDALQPLPLGNDVFNSGYISAANIFSSEEIFRDFGNLMQDYGVVRYKAMATSAVREALNKDIFIDRIEQSSNLRLSILEGSGEARLLYLAIKQALNGRFGFNTGDSIIYTIGTGSSQISLVEEGNLVNAETIRLGTLRLAEEVGQKLSPGNLPEAVDPLIAATFLGIARMSKGVHPENLIAVGAPVRGLVSIIRNNRQMQVATISRDVFENFFAKLSRINTQEFVNRYGLTDIDAAGVLPCCHMLEQLFAISEASRIIVPMINTRDALAEDLLREMAGKPDSFIPQIMSSAEHLGRRYGYDRQHARKVADLALILFDKLGELHGLSERNRVLLEVVGLLHDIGMFISNRQHHKHSSYLLRNSELPGISKKEQNLISLIARYHRRATPYSSHVEFTSQPPEDRVTVSKMAAILRVADALDRAHQNKIKNLRVSFDREKVVLTAMCNSNLILARWGLRMKSNMFEQVFGRRVVLQSAQY